MHRSQQCSRLVVSCLQAVKQHNACQNASRVMKAGKTSTAQHTNKASCNLSRQSVCGISLPVTTWCHCQMCRVQERSCAVKAWHLQHMRHMDPVELQQGNIQLLRSANYTGAACATCCYVVLAMHWVTAGAGVVAFHCCRATAQPPEPC
jgi:hypothetical protein